MAVIHILKDGSVKSDITGHVVRYEDAAPLYRYIKTLNGSSKRNERKNEATA